MCLTEINKKLVDENVIDFIIKNLNQYNKLANYISKDFKTFCEFVIFGDMLERNSDMFKQIQKFWMDLYRDQNYPQVQQMYKRIIKQDHEYMKKFISSKRNSYNLDHLL